jgi:hypothetical protein
MKTGSEAKISDCTHAVFIEPDVTTAGEFCVEMKVE